MSAQYPFDDFKSALAFANRIGELAEEHQHHPVMAVEWGRVVLEWWTHKINNIHWNDLKMASAGDELYN